MMCRLQIRIESGEIEAQTRRNEPGEAVPAAKCVMGLIRRCVKGEVALGEARIVNILMKRESRGFDHTHLCSFDV